MPVVRSGSRLAGELVMPLFFRLLFLVVTSCYVATSNAASPRENFENDKLLESAVEEISTLDRDQLEAVINYIANCNPASASERNLGCEQATKIVQIKTSRATSLALISLAISVVDNMIQWERSPPTDLDDKNISRRADILFEFSRAASKRYEVLRIRDATTQGIQ